MYGSFTNQRATINESGPCSLLEKRKVSAGLMR